MLFLLAACKPPIEAPTELNELSRYLYREFEAAEPEVMAAGLANLEAWLASLDLTVDTADRSYSLEPLDADDVAGLTRPEDRSLSDLLGLGIAYDSPYPQADHDDYVVWADQLSMSPLSAWHTRTFDGDGASCLPDAGCEVARATDELYKDSLFINVELTLEKDFRWVTMDDGDQALVARAWFEQSFHGGSGNNHLWQNHALDVYVPRDDGHTWRWYTTWAESEFSGADEDIRTGILRSGIADFLEACDEAASGE